MKKSLILISFLFFLFLISGCSSMNVLVDYDKLNDFSNYETYRIVKPKKQKDNNSIYVSSINQRRFVSNIEDVLNQKGFQRTPDDENADFGVIYHLRFDKKLDITSYGYKYYPLSGYRERFIQTRTYQQGSIIIDVIDREQKLLVWRGVAEGVLRETDNPEKVIKKAITEILKEFPPTR